MSTSIPDNIRPLTALRFFAAAWVVLYHYWPHLQGVTDRPPLIEKGYLGVEAFFTLSGFILCHVYLRTLENAKFSYGGFLWNRLARVYPLHIACLVGMGAMAAAAGLAGMAIDPNILSWRALPANLTLTHAWGLTDVAGWNHPSWSISAEWFAYLLFPVFGWVAIQFRDRPWLGLNLALGFMAIVYPAFERLAGFSLTQATFAWGALRIVPCFLLGCAVHGLWRSGALAGARNGGLIAAFSGAAALLAAQLSLPDMVAVAAFGGLIFGLATLAKAGSSFASQSPLTYLGEISYSIYMVCVPWSLLAFNGFQKALGIEGDQLPLWAWAVSLVAVVPLAAASYHLIEHPARAGMKRLARSVDRRRMATAVA